MVFIGLRASALVALLGFACLGQASSPGSTCASSAEVLEEEEVSQLQHTVLPRGRGRGFGGIKFKEKTCDPPCQNGGRCLFGIACSCVAGWKGKACTEPTELSQEVEHHLGSCSNNFEVFPYIQPGLWGTYTGWETCGEGRSQSPINIPAHPRKVSPRGPLDLTFNALKKPVILNNGHNAEIEGEFLEFKLAGNTYSAKQFHFHTPSEHRVAGRGFAMEMHIVTKTEAGEAAVIGILFQLGKANRCLTEIRKLPNAGCEDHVNMTVDLACFEEQLAGPWWSYDGSLTTPPCSEGVKWQVMQKKATLSLAQLLIFRSRFKLNARPPQPLNGREVLLQAPRRPAPPLK